jgi:hypothetical protein
MEAESTRVSLFCWVSYILHMQRLWEVLFSGQTRVDGGVLRCLHSHLLTFRKPQKIVHNLPDKHIKKNLLCEYSVPFSTETNATATNGAARYR